MPILTQGVTATLMSEVKCNMQGVKLLINEAPFQSITLYSGAFDISVYRRPRRVRLFPMRCLHT